MTTDEVRRAGPVPRWELPALLERHGVIAGVTGRDDATGEFDLGLATSRPIAEVMGNWRSFLGSLPQFQSQVISRQVHGTTVARHDIASSGWTITEGFDGHITTLPGVLLMVTVADCVPVYLVAPDRRGVALLHAGWRGAAAGILTVGVRELAERTGVSPSDLFMHCGVAISGPRYEVGAEVMAAFGKSPTGDGPWHLDVREELVEQGRNLGIVDISISSHCTALAPDHFHSHRRSRGRDGRMIAYLGMPPL